MTLKFHTDGSRMFVCSVCDKHLDLEDNAGGSYCACKEHKAEMDARHAAEEKTWERTREADRGRWFDNYREVVDTVPACPYCFKEFGDWWECFKNEDGYDTELECGWCEETFSATLHIAYSFTTKRKDSK